MLLSAESLATILRALDYCLDDAAPAPNEDAIRRAWVDVRAIEILTRENREPRQ